MDARRAAEWTARNSYGRLLAFLAARSRDVTSAEDALGEAFESALKTWPHKGVPANPEGWLLVTAKRRLIDSARRKKVRRRVLNTIRDSGCELPNGEINGAIFSDDRLKLMFVCAHPAIASHVRTPLMLQTVLGMNAAQIASSFLVSPSAMGQRLVRAKAKIREAGIPFQVPTTSQLPSRLEAVLSAIYAAYTTGWDDVEGGDDRPSSLAEEAVWLARLSVQLMPEEPETRGLLALMLHCEARRSARRTETGDYIPLSEQNPKKWSKTMLNEAEIQLRTASLHERMGRFQLEAAIQSVHAQRAVSGRTCWKTLAKLYEGLIWLSPTIGAMVGYAAAIAESEGYGWGLSILNDLPEERVTKYQPYWALKAHLLRSLGYEQESRDAYSTAIGLTEDRAIGEFLLKQAQGVGLGFADLRSSTLH